MASQGMKWRDPVIYIMAKAVTSDFTYVKKWLLSHSITRQRKDASKSPLKTFEIPFPTANFRHLKEMLQVPKTLIGV